jgi:hypothetical protein
MLQIVGSIPDEFIEFFNDLIISVAFMVLGSNQPLTESSARNLPGW